MENMILVIAEEF